MTIKNFIKKHLKRIIKFPASKKAYSLLKDLNGIEIGASSQCDFMLNSLNVDVSNNENSEEVFYQEQKRHGYGIKKVDVVASGDNLPFADSSLDYVITSHVLEHFFDPIKALKEWHRVIKNGGYIFMIVPHKERTFDKDKQRTALRELIDRHEGRISEPDFEPHHHYSVWVTEDVLELCKYLDFNVIEYYDKDDNIGNGFTIIIKKEARE